MNQLSSETDQPRSRRFEGQEGVDFVRCRICGHRLRVISGRHLSKHEIDRDSYMDEYGLSPDELIAKDFRRIQSSRRGYHPYTKQEWIAAVRKSMAAKAKFPRNTFNASTLRFITKAYGSSVIGMKRFAQLILIPNGCGRGASPRPTGRRRGSRRRTCPAGRSSTRPGSPGGRPAG